jgi:hypothetical protein
MQNKILMWVVIVGVLLIAAMSGIGYILTKQTPQEIAWQNPPAPKTVPATTSNTPQGDDALVYLFEPEDSNRPNWDFQIIEERLKTGERKILVPSIKAAIPALQESQNRTLTFLSTSTNEKILFFKDIYSESDSGVNALYAFYITQLSFEKLPIKPHEFILSPNGQRIAFITVGGNIPQKIEVYDLNEKTFIASASLEMTETAVSWDGYDVPYIQWMNDDQIKYRVYKNSDINATKPPTEIPFRERTLMIGSGAPK